MRLLPPVVLAAFLLPALGGCTAMAVGGAVVGAGVAVASTAVSAGVAVGKGTVRVASAPFRDGEEEKTKK